MVLSSAMPTFLRFKLNVLWTWSSNSNVSWCVISTNENSWVSQFSGQYWIHFMRLLSIHLKDKTTTKTKRRRSNTLQIKAFEDLFTILSNGSALTSLQLLSCRVSETATGKVWARLILGSTRSFFCENTEKSYLQTNLPELIVVYLVTMTMTDTCCSQAICQKSPWVCGSGPVEFNNDNS